MSMSKKQPVACQAKINEKIMPVDRGEVYEDPLT